MSEFIQRCSKAWMYGFIGGIFAGIVIIIVRALA